MIKHKKPLLFSYVANGEMTYAPIDTIKLVKESATYYEFHLHLATNTDSNELARVVFEQKSTLEKRKTTFDLTVYEKQLVKKKNGMQIEEVPVSQTLHLRVYLLLQAFAASMYGTPAMHALFTQDGALNPRCVKINWTILTKKSISAPATWQHHKTEIFKIRFNDYFGRYTTNQDTEYVFEQLPFEQKLLPAKTFVEHFYASEQSGKKPLEVLSTFLWDRLEENEQFELRTMTQEDIVSFIKKSTACSVSYIESFQSKITAFCTYYNRSHILPNFRALKNMYFTKPTATVVNGKEMGKTLTFLEEQYKERIALREADYTQKQQGNDAKTLYAAKNQLFIEKRDYAMFCLVVYHGIHPVELTTLTPSSLQGNRLWLKGRAKLEKHTTKKLDSRIKELAVLLQQTTDPVQKDLYQQKQDALKKQLATKHEQIRTKRGALTLLPSVLAALHDYIETYAVLFDERLNGNDPLFLVRRDYDVATNTLAPKKAVAPENCRFIFSYQQVQQGHQKKREIVCTVEEVLRYLVYKKMRTYFSYTHTPTLDEMLHVMKEYDKRGLVKDFYKQILVEIETEKRFQAGTLQPGEYLVLDRRGMNKNTTKHAFKVKKM